MDDLEAARKLRDRAARRVEELEAEREEEEARRRSRRAELVGLAVDHLLTERGERERRRDLALWYLLAVAGPDLKRERLVRQLRLWTEGREEANELASEALRRREPDEDRLETLALCRRAGVEPPPSQADHLEDRLRPEETVDGVLDAVKGEGGPSSPDEQQQPPEQREGG